MRFRTTVPLFALVAAFGLAADVVSGETGHKKQADHSGLKSFAELAGDWVGRMSEDGQHWMDVTVKYTVTSGGSAVVETMGPGSPHEMVTVIHQDGKELGLTHYCSIGNQPHMKAKIVDGSNKYDFAFTGASNMASDKDMHMHDVTYTIVDKDTVRAVWTSYEDGKKSGTATFEIKRKK
jgi:hypothetical protein